MPLPEPSDDEDLRSGWRLDWLGNIAEIADLGLQRRMWLDPENRNPHWSFVEFCESYFDRLTPDNTYNYPLSAGFISPRELSVVSAFHEAIDNYNSPRGEDWNNAAVLDDPLWHDVVRLARQARVDLSAIVTTEHERMILLGEQ